MIEIPVYNKTGQIEYMLILPEDVQFVSGRTSKGDKLYYKGVGSKYFGHSSLSLCSLENHGQASVFYYGWNVKNAAWDGKFGIFQERYQPYFSDQIGTCGPKELKIVSNSALFQYSAVSVVDAIQHDEENQQYYFILNYKSARTKYMSKPAALIRLMAYMVNSGWNFPWDKTSINDINAYGYVTDVADLFQSDDIRHAFGTVYSVLYSLYMVNRDGYNALMKTVSFSGHSISDIPFVTLLFLRLFDKDIHIKQNIKTKKQLYAHLVGNILLRGRNCAGVEDINQSNSVMIQYLDRFKKQLGEDDLSVLEVY